MLEQLLVGLRQHVAERLDLLRRADAGDDVLALRVHQELAVEHVLAARRVAREADAGAESLAHVAEHHRLDVDGGAPLGRDAVQPAVADGAVVAPRSGTPPRSRPRAARTGSSGKSTPACALDLRLELGDELLERLGRAGRSPASRRTPASSRRGSPRTDRGPPCSRASCRARRRRTSRRSGGSCPRRSARSPTSRPGRRRSCRSARGSGPCPSCRASRRARRSGPRRAAGSSGRRTSRRRAPPSWPSRRGSRRRAPSAASCRRCRTRCRRRW